MSNLSANLKVAVIAALTSATLACGAHANPVEGHNWSNETIAPNATIYYDVTCRANEVTAVDLVGDGNSDLDLYVYDEQGNQICFDRRLTDRASVSFTPYFTTIFRIYVVNAGSRYNRYRIDMF